MAEGPLRARWLLCFRGLLDRGEGDRNAPVRGLGAVGDLGFGVVAVPVVESVREEVR
jgi:hypothetical protein